MLQDTQNGRCATEQSEYLTAEKHLYILLQLLAHFLKPPVRN